MTEHSDEVRAQASAPKDSTVGELFSRLSDQILYLFKGEFALAKAKAVAMATNIGAGVVALAAAGVLALYLLGILLYAAVLGFSVIMPAWAAALVVAAILLIVIVVLVLIGQNLLRKGKDIKPDLQTGLKLSAEAVKKGFEAGKD